MDEPEFRARWADERAVVATWLPDAEPEPGLLPSPDRGVRLARELRLLLRSVPNADRATASLAGGLAQLLSGRPPAARATLLGALDQPVVAAWERLALRLALQLAQLGEPDPGAAGPARGDHPVRRRGGPVLALPGRAGPAGGPAADGRPGPVAGGDLRRPGQRLRTTRRPLGQLPARGRGRLRVRARSGRTRRPTQLLRQAAEAASGLHAPVLEVWATAFALQIRLAAGNVVAPVEACAVRRRAERLGAVGAVRLCSRRCPRGRLPASAGTPASG